jgi:hypothetical protein
MGASEELRLAADCLAMDAGVAQQNSRTIDDLLVVWSDVRGLGSVDVGPDRSLLFFNTNVSPQDAVGACRAGRRTSREKFDVFRRGGS